MDRAERTSLGLAIVGHLLLLGALSFSLVRPTPKLAALNPPIDVALIDATALETAAPDPTLEASGPPAPSTAEADTPQPVTPTPKPLPAPDPTKRTSRLDSSLADRLARAANRESTNPGTGRGQSTSGSGTPATKTAAQLEASYIQALIGQIKRYWRAPTGVDAELLKTVVVVTLNRDGSVADIRRESQVWNENNANLKDLHFERAQAAIRRAAPFPLPAENYAIWQSLRLTFDKRLN